jgi:hypothetical protein
MASTYSNIKIELMEPGFDDNTWGDTTNVNLGTAMEQAMVGMATVSTGFTSNIATLTLSNTNALQDARALCLNVTATLTAAGTLNVPAIQKPYVVFNNTSGGFALTVKVSGQTGVSVPNGKKTVLYNNGTDVGEQINYLSGLTLGSALGAASGGTGLTAPGTNGNLLTSNGTAWVSSPPAVSGTVTTVSVVSANGLAGTVATATSTPAITLSTTITGVLKGNGTAISAATAGTDYSAGTNALATGILKSTTSTGALTIAVSGTDYAPGTSALATGIVKSTTSTGALTIATAGTDYVTPSGTETLSNKTITQRVVASTTDTTPVVTNGDTTDIATFIYTLSATTITFSAPSGTPVNGQKLIIRIRTTVAQTLSWNAVFAGSTTTPLPTASSGSSKFDYVGFIYNDTAGVTKWQLVGASYGY